MTEWESIVREHGPAVWRTAYRLLGSRSDADDCMQETFVAMVRIARNGSVRNWQALLNRLVVSKGVDCLRRRKHFLVQHVDDQKLADIISDEQRPDEIAQNNELVSTLRSALLRLPKRQAEIVCLRYLGEMEYEEISRELGIDVRHVGVVLSRAREKLRQMLQRRGADHG